MCVETNGFQGRLIMAYEFNLMSLHATFGRFNMLIQEAIALNMIRFLFLLEMYGQKQSDLSSVRVDSKA